jgi:hypothetical protein
MPKVGIKLCVSALICRLVVNLDKKNAWVDQAFSGFGDTHFAMMVTLLRNKSCFLH